MSSLLASIPAKEENIANLGDGEPGPVGPFTIYQVAATNQERIEAVSVTVDYDANTLSEDIFFIRLVSPAGLVMYTAATPPMKKTGSPGSGPAEWEITWARRGTGTDQAPPLIFTADSEALSQRGVWTGLIPDIVLAPNSSVTFERYVVIEGGSLAVSVSALTVTVTRDPGDSGQTIVVEPVGPFMLVPGPAA